MSKAFLILPILLPVLGGVGIYLIPFRSRHGRNLFTAAAVTVNSAAVFTLILTDPPERVELLRIMEDVTLALRLDGLGKVFLALIAILWPIACLYAFAYMQGSHKEARFFSFYTVCYGVTAGVALSANLVTMYLFYELLTLVTIPLVAHEEDKRSMDAAKKYIIYSMSGAAVSFIGIVILLTQTGGTEFLYGGVGATGESPGLVLGYMLTFLGFGVKAAIFPFHDWLPSASVAPTPVTALLHAVAVVKSGAFACIRSTYYAFGPDCVRGTWAQYTALGISVFTIVFGSLMAYKEQHLKRRLAYSTVSNLNYILFGAALMTDGGLIAAMSHLFFHGIMKITAFFCVGAVLCGTGREYAPQMEGIGRKMPLTFAAFTVSSVALIGTPLFPGFISKMNLMTAAVESGQGGLGIAALLLSALLTGAYMLPLCIRSFLPGKASAPIYTARDRDPGLCMLVPFALLCAMMLLLGVCGVPFMSLLERTILSGTGGGM